MIKTNFLWDYKVRLNFIKWYKKVDKLEYPESKKIRADERGVSVVLGATLVIAIAVTAWAIFYPSYVQSSLKEKEVNHTRQVRSKLLELQSRVSWMDGRGEGGSVEIPMSAGSVFLFPSESPAGTLTTNPGSEIENASENITIDPGSIEFHGQNLYYPDQTYVFEGGHVFLVQDGTEIMISSSEDLISWADKLEVDTLRVGKDESSISSTGAETVTLAWGGRDRFPRDKKWENSNSFRINFETQYENVWKNYLGQKAEKIGEYVENVDAGVYENGAYLRIENDRNIKYFISATEIGGDIVEPTVETLETGEVTNDTAVLIMRHDFEDYAYGEVRFEWKSVDSEAWSATGWETAYGSENYSFKATGLSPSTDYLYRGHIRFDGRDKVGDKENFTTEGGIPGDGGWMQPPYAPRAPENLVATATSSLEIELDWDHDNTRDFNYYNIYRSTSSDFTGAEWIGQHPEKNYTDSNLTPNTTYYYKVTAVDSDGNESRPSNMAENTTYEETLIYNNDAIAVDGEDDSENAGGVVFSVKNLYSDSVTIDNIRINPLNDNINELDDQVGGGNDDPGEVEIYAEAPNNDDSYSDWATGGGEGPEALAVDNDGVEVVVGEDGTNLNSGNLPRVDSGNDLTWYLYEFYTSPGAPTDYETNQNIDMGGEKVDITFNYTVGGVQESKTLRIDPATPANAPPTADFTYDISSIGPWYWVEFDASGSSDLDGSIESYEWDFGDGETGTGETVSHVYDTSDTYTVTLTVTDDDGATDTETKQITVE